MKCGHTANATCDGKPVCVICAGIVAGADEIDENPPSLDGRQMRCSDCGATRASDPAAAFFRHWPEREFDQFYSGCRGWD